MILKLQKSNIVAKSIITPLLIGAFFHGQSQATFAAVDINSFAVIDLRAIYIDNENENWISGNIDSLRFDEDDSNIQIGQAIFGGQLKIRSEFIFEGTISAYDDDGESIGINEAFFEYRPLPFNGYRITSQIGIFFPDISLENTERGWLSKNVITNSAINAWIGEEIKQTGIKLQLIRPGKYHHSSWDYSIDLTAFQYNDPAGSLLAWRAWALHDRQVRYGEKIRFAELPSIAEDGDFNQQSPYFDPNVEIDNSIGYSAGINLRHSSQFSIDAFYYDNRADPEIIINGQYGWKTRFYHLALRSPPIGPLRFKSQILFGDTLMGTSTGSNVDADYQSWYLSAEYTRNKWVHTIRFDDYEVKDQDNIPMDNNNQNGNAWTAASAYTLNRSAKVIAEFLIIDDDNYARQYFGRDVGSEIKQFQIALQWRFNR